VRPVLGLLALHLMGAVMMALAARVRVLDALRSASSAWVAVAMLFAASLGPAGLLVGGALLAVLFASRSVLPSLTRGMPWTVLAVVALLVLARPWVPTQWDEFIWLAKARLESQGFGAGVTAALDPALHVLPPGYPPLWPEAVSWVALGSDALEAQVLAGSLLLVLALGSAMEAWWPVVRRARPMVLISLAATCTAPLVWVHLRSVYVDLPLGLLALALLGFLCSGRPGLASVVAVVMAGLKDEGLPQVLAATVGAMAVMGVQRPLLPRLAPAGLAVLVVMTWRLLLARHDITVVDHALATPAWAWAPDLVRLLVLHAADVFSWGVFWAVVLSVALMRRDSPSVIALSWSLLASLAFIAAALLAGPERVRVFAENGTLINRLLMQLWPTAALLVWLGLSDDDAASRQAF